MMAGLIYFERRLPYVRLRRNGECIGQITVFFEVALMGSINPVSYENVVLKAALRISIGDEDNLLAIS